MRVELIINAVFSSMPADAKEMVKEIQAAEEEEVTIYEISAVSPLRLPDLDVTIIHSYGANFVVKKAYKEVIKEIYHNKRIK